MGARPISPAPSVKEWVDPDVGPAWRGDASLREAALERARADRPTELGVYNRAPYDVPGAPAAIRAISSELLASEQARRDMAYRLEAFEMGVPDPPHNGCRGTDKDLRELAVELIDATALGADLRKVAREWLCWAFGAGHASLRAPLHGHAARNWANAGGAPIEGVRKLIELVASAPAWPAEVSA